MRLALARARLREVDWLNRICARAELVTDDKKRAEIYRYAIERVEYAASNPTVPTGIEELDEILYGGVPEGYAILITSPPLDEKDLLSESFLLEGVRKDELVLLISTRLRGVYSKLVTERQDNFNLMLCSPWADNMVQEGPNILKLQGVEDLTQLNISLNVFLRDIEEREKSLKRVVLDIVSDALLLHDLRVVRRWLMDLLSMFKYKKASTISTLDPGMHSTDEVRTIIDLFDGLLEVTERQVHGGRRNTLTVKRLYNKKHLERPLVLEREKLTHPTRSTL